MTREVFIVLNVSTNEIEIKDFGLLLPTDVSIDLADFDESYLSNEIDQYLFNGDLVRIVNGVSVGYSDAFVSDIPLSINYLPEASLNKNTFFFDASSLLDVSVGKYETKKFLAGKSSTQVLTGSYSDVTNWDLALINTSTVAEPLYSWDETNGILTFGKSGWYEINIQMNTDVLSGGTRANTAFKLQEDTGSGYVDIPYSETWMYNRTSGQGADNGSFFTIRNYSDGDTLKIQALEDGGDNQITSAQISVIKSEIGGSLTIFDVSGGVSQLYVDGSLLLRDASIEQIFGDYFGNTAEFLYESSLGAGFVFNTVTDVYDVSITGAVGLYAWARTTDAGAVIDTYGLTVNRTGTGVYQYTFNSPLTNANYGIIGQPFGTIQDTNCQVANVTNTGFELTFGSGDNGTAPDVPVDAEHSVMVLGPPTEVGLGVSKDYVDGSLSARDASLEFIFQNGLEFVKEASLGNKFFFDASGFLDVSVAGGSGDVTKAYVDGSLAERDASIEVIFVENDIQDSSISGLRNRLDIIDGSITFLDSSIDQLFGLVESQDPSIQDLYDGQFVQDSSISDLRNRLDIVDGSIIFIDNSINQLFSEKADLSYVDGSLNQLRIDVDASFQSIELGLTEFLTPIDGTTSDVSALIVYANRQVLAGQPIYLHDPSDLGFVFDSLSTGNVYNNLPWIGINGGGSAPRLKLSGSSSVFTSVGIRGVEFYIEPGASVELLGLSEHARVDLTEIRFGIGPLNELSLRAVNATVGRVEGQTGNSNLYIKDRTFFQCQNLNEIEQVEVEGGAILLANWVRINTVIDVGWTGTAKTTKGAIVTIASPQNLTSGKINVYGDNNTITCSGFPIDVSIGALNNTIIGQDNTVTDDGTNTIILENIPTEIELRLKEASLGSQFSFDASGFLQVDVSGGGGDVTQAYVDGSLAERDASILWLVNNTYTKTYIDASLNLKVNRTLFDASIAAINLKNINQDASIAVNAAAIAAKVYGTQFQLVQSLGASTTTSTTPVVKASMNTTSLPAGTYKITVAWIWNRNSGSNSALFDVALNGTPQGTTSTMQIEIKDTTDSIPLVRIFYLNLSGTNTIEFRYWGETGFSTTTVSDATIELIRVS